jgi:hypothetical protein
MPHTKQPATDAPCEHDWRLATDIPVLDIYPEIATERCANCGETREAPTAPVGLRTLAGERISADEYIYLTETRDQLTAAQEARERAEVEWGAAHAAATSFIHHLLRKHRLRKDAGDDLDLETGIITRGMGDA